VYDGDDVVAILPLVQCAHELRFVGYSSSDYNAFLCLPEIAVQALALSLDTLFDAQPRPWKNVALENVRKDSSLFHALTQLPDRWRRLIAVSVPTPCPTLILGEAREQLLTEILSKEKVRKTCKAIMRLGEVRFRHLETASEIRAHLPRFAEQHVARCVLDGRQSQFLKSDYRSFFSYLTEELALADQLRFSILEVGGHPVAYHIGHQVEGKYLFYKPTFDIELWDYSPGQVLLFKLFESFLNSTVREFDFGQGGESYKYRFANACRQNVTFTIYRPNALGTLMRLAAHTRSVTRFRVRAAVEEHPKLLNWVTRIQAGLSGRGARMTLRSTKDRPMRIHALPSAVEVQDTTRLQSVTLGDLAQRAARHAGFLSTESLHHVRERLRKGGTAYADCDWQYVVVAYRATAVELSDGPRDLGDPGLVFEVIHGSARKQKPLVHGMAQVAAQRGLTAWLISDTTPDGF
jgi:CelD/BcsL family acetyltransferase involved in cellulose biosynthesis